MRDRAFRSENVASFFSNLDRVLAGKPIQGVAIWNMDETEFSIVPTKSKKVLALKAAKWVGQLLSRHHDHHRRLNTAISSISSEKHAILVHGEYIYRRDWSREWFGMDEEKGFVQILEHLSHATPILLLLDNHLSHLSIAGLDYCSHERWYAVVIPTTLQTPPRFQEHVCMNEIFV